MFQHYQKDHSPYDPTINQKSGIIKRWYFQSLGAEVDFLVNEIEITG